MSDFLIVNNGLCTAVVCTTLTIEEATKKLNRVNPTGVSSKWSLMKGTKKKPNHALCQNDPTKTHYVFEC